MPTCSREGKSLVVYKNQNDTYTGLACIPLEGVGFPRLQFRTDVFPITYR